MLLREINRAIVQLMLELGADPNISDATGATALTTALQEDADSAIASLSRRPAPSSTS